MTQTARLRKALGVRESEPGNLALRRGDEARPVLVQPSSPLASATSRAVGAAAADRYADYRQVGVLDRSGRGTVSARGKPQPWSGHLVGENYVAMVNSATREEVVQAMARNARLPKPSA